MEKCRYARECGGCQYQGTEYKKQLQMKKNYIEKLLKPFCPVKDMVGMENPYNYRNKVHAVFGRDKKGNIYSGVYKAGTHDIVPVEKCQIEDETADHIIATIGELAQSFRYPVYDEDRQTGLLRHVLIRRGFTSGEIMVVLVCSSLILPSKKNFVNALLKAHPQITTIVLNENNKRTTFVLGNRETVLYGKGYITDTLCGKTFKISSKSFYQINPLQTEKLYQKAMELAGLTGRERVIDAYCGIGTIGIVAAKKAKEVIGIELNKDAVADAKENARLNKASNTRFYCGDAGDFMVEMAARGQKADVVFMDPPRSGSTEKFICSIVKLAPKRVVYISCGPDTLARDLKVFARLGYRAEEAWGYDMFPFTEHVETVCLLSRKAQ